ncbi:MAG: type I glyceraldehyde-3-phosphate dehydrogenase [Chloroflexi bacterium]|nr:type I glyceraldehyde-3-phosphate dehydrogenase [Chloroflexota bacterium]
MIKVGINGFGRIGRLAFRALNEYYKNDVQVLAINDLTDAKTNAHLLKYDSNYGIFKGEISTKDNNLIVNGQEITVFSFKNPADIPWGDKNIDIVLECTGLFTDGQKAKTHLQGSVKKVLISAPATNEDITIVIGVNDNMYDYQNHHIISNASCTTNCLAPVVKVLNDEFGIEKGLMTTTHSYTNDQKINDMAHSDLRRARSAATNIIPTSTGAAKAISRVIPELAGKLHGIALRVPTPTVSVVDLTIDLKRNVTKEEINNALQKAADNTLKGIMGYCIEPLVSSDFKGCPLSSIIDAENTMVIGHNMAKVVAWYDNEWGYSCRLADLTVKIAQFI